MRTALFMLLVITAMTSASASMSTPSFTPGAQAASGSIFPLTQQDAAARVKTSTLPDAPTLQTVALKPATGQAGQTTAKAEAGSEADTEADGWERFAPLVFTLALIGAIAVRRHKGGKS